MRCFVLHPSEAYVNNLDYPKPLNEREVRDDLRDRLGVDRLKSGTHIWPNDGIIEQMNQNQSCD